jgi:Protein of unknown function (DUF3311)
VVTREPADPASTPESRARAERHDRSPWNWLLLLPLVVTLFPPIYNNIDPRLFDWPFFYWYQMAAIVLSVVVTLAVYQKSRD